MIGAGVIAGIALVLMWLARRMVPKDLLEFPPPAVALDTARPSVDDFVGAAVCGECHQTQYLQWRRSTHGRAGGTPNSESVIAPFDGRPMRFKDATVIPTVSNGEYKFTVRQDGRDDVIVRVDGVIGRGHMVGGGTQGFVSAFPDGTVRFLPFDYIRDEAEWFCNTNPRTGQGWVPITSNLRLADCGDWPPIRILGTDERLANCQECHGSQISVDFDVQAERYTTHIQTYAVNCESCHGPGARHVERARADALSGAEDIGIEVLGALDKDASLEVCFQCHAVKTTLQPGYLPGAPLERYYSTKLSVVGDEPYYPDGRIRTFGYQQNHLYSDCYLNGSMTCVDCHEPHSSDYRDIYGQRLDSRFSDGQCLSCHPSKAEDVGRHTKHAADSPGSRCVSCHMPYLQHPEVGRALRFARSDHTIAIPRPTFDEDLGVTPACRTCHHDLALEVLQRQTDEWYGAIKPHKDIVRSLFEFTPQMNAGQAARLLLRPDARHPMAALAAMNEFQERHLRPNMPALDTAISAPLMQLAQSEDLDVRAFALAILHYAHGDDRSIRRFLFDQLRAPRGGEVPLRSRWVIILGYLGDFWRIRGELGTATVVYRKALEVFPGDARILAQLADATSLAGDHAAALEQFERALHADPNRPLTWVNYGVALERANRGTDAAEAYRRALRINPSEALADFNLGNFYLRRNELDQAIGHYEAAVASNPALAQAHYYLARSLMLANRLEDALASAERALEFDPENGTTRQAVEQLRQAVGR